jgi:hypothetical protein
MRFEVLTALILMITVFLDATSSFYIGYHLCGAFCLHPQGRNICHSLIYPKNLEIPSSETLIFIYETTRRHSAEDSSLRSESIFMKVS